MTFVRNLFADLVAKRLWPVALALVVALIAVPVMLAAPGEPEPAILAAPVAADGPGGPALVELATEARRGGRNSTGLDPFRGLPGADADADGGSAAEGEGVAERLREALGLDGGSSSGGVSAGGGGTDLGPIDVVSPIGGGGPTLPGGGGDEDAPPSLDSYTIDVRVGQTGRLRAADDVVRLSPLPSQTDPFLVFLGVLADGRTATFLVSDDARATGDGVCRPRPGLCERIEMQAGDTEFFDVEQENGEIVQYQLDLRAVRRVRAASASQAALDRDRESAEGRDMLRLAIDRGDVHLDGLAYSPDLGLILPDGSARQEQPGGLFGGFATDLRFGEPGAQTEQRDLARLTPLPDPDEPAFLFLGVLNDGYTALFLNPTGAAVSGDGTCMPDPETCTRVEVPAGGGVVFDVPMMDGETTEYALDVDSITPITADSRAEAERSRTRESEAGRSILRALLAEVGDLIADLSFDTDTGTIVPAE